jgi:hypothetical protein
MRSVEHQNSALGKNIIGLGEKRIREMTLGKEEKKVLGGS